MAYRVIQWATGGIGRAAIEGIVSHPELELVGAWVHSEKKSGMDVGEIVGCGSLGVTATNDVDALLAMDADCVMYDRVMANKQELIRILESGKNVVTPLNWFYRGDRNWSKLEDACQKGGVTLHGTGINPGGVTERFPLMVSALSRNIRHVRAEEFSDIRTYNAEFVVREVMMFGKPPSIADNSPMPELLGRGCYQSIDMVADALGLEERLARADLVITGEGSLDAQTLSGKGPAGLARMAREAGVKVVGIGGRVTPEIRESGLFDQVGSLEVFKLPVEESMRRGAELLELTGRKLAGLLRDGEMA